MTGKNYRTGTWLILLSLVFMAGLGACAAGPVGIFASIAQETDINATRTKAFNGTSPDFVGKFGTNYYTSINGTIWSRPVTGVVWTNKVVLPPGVSQGEATSAVVTSTKLFVVFGKIGDSTQKVWTTTDMTEWNPVFSASLPDIKIDSLLIADDQVFAVTRADTIVEKVTTAKYSVYYWNGSGFLPAGTEVTNISSRPTSAAKYATDNYWITAGTSVYSGALGSMAVLGETPADTFAGVVKESDNNMILSSRTGILYKYNGSVWSASSVLTKSEKPYAFSTPVIASAAGKSHLLVGTVPDKNAAVASGYLEFDVTDGFNPASTQIKDGSGFALVVNFQTSVSANYIRSFTVADEGGGKLRVFALTIGNGLWSNFFDGSAWTDGWARE